MESYLHKMAKELLYNEIEEKSGFEYKLSNGDVGVESLITRDDYRGECVLMEFPTKEGYYPDEFGCTHPIEKYICDEFICGTKKTGFRFNNGKGYCKCSECEHYNFNGGVVHDIAAFWKGNVRWAIEIINKHEPSWDEVYSSRQYYIFLVKAEDVLKRVDKTPVFVYKIIKTGYPQ